MMMKAGNHGDHVGGDDSSNDCRVGDKDDDDDVDVLVVKMQKHVIIISLMIYCMILLMCCIGDLDDLYININHDEVEECFTVPLEDLLNEKNWSSRNFSAPVFTGGPYNIWGLTGYLLQKFMKEVIIKCSTKE